MISKKFLKSSILYTAASTLSTFASFILLPFYTNTHLLKVADYGALALYISLSLLIQIVVCFSLDFYVAVAYHDLKDNPAELKAKIASLNGYLIVIGCAVILLCYVSGDFIIRNFIDNPNPDSFRYIMMSVFTGIFTAHFKFYNSLLTHLEKPQRYFWSNILNFVTTVFFSLFILYKYPLTLEGPMWGRLLSCFSIFLLSFFEITFVYGIALSKRFITATWKFCLPLMITTIFQWVLAYSDRYIIKSMLYNKEVAVFDLAVRFTLLVSFILDGVSNAMAPKIFSLLKGPTTDESAREMNKLYSGFNLIVLILVPINIFVLPIVLPLFISDEKYLQAFFYFGIICSGFVTRSVLNVYLYPIYAFKKTSRLIFINGITAIFQVVICYLMVRQFKLYGASFTLNAIKVLTMFLFIFYCRDLTVTKINQKKLIWLPIVVIMVFSFFELFINQYGIYMHLIHLVELFVVFALTYLVYKNEISGLLKWGIQFAKSKMELTK